MEEILKGLGYQSYSISNTIFEQNLLAHQAPFPVKATTQATQPAECVGSLWQTISISETTQEEKNTSSLNSSSSHIEKHPHKINRLPAAEPVGNFTNPTSLSQKIKLFYYGIIGINFTTTHKKKNVINLDISGKINRRAL